jgi:DDE superfamily endonuclease
MRRPPADHPRVVSTLDDRLVGNGHSVDPDRWRALFDELMGRIAGRFRRVEPRRWPRAFVLGLIAGLPRKNCWTIAEHAGGIMPHGMQHLLERASWDADEVRDGVRGCVTEHLADAHAVLVVDETEDVKKGIGTAGVHRQYTGTAGRVENAQVAVYLTHAGRCGQALIDRRLYLPRSWAGDPARRAAAGIPDEVALATKPALAPDQRTHAHPVWLCGLSVSPRLAMDAPRPMSAQRRQAWQWTPANRAAGGACRAAKRSPVRMTARSAGPTRQERRPGGRIRPG